MPIPEEQLKTWSKQGPIQSSEITHKSIRKCIGMVNWSEDVDYKTYLQGSYPNRTNIYGNSDVDLVVEFCSLFSYDLSALSQSEKELFDSNHLDAKYSLIEFKKSVINQLKQYYGDDKVTVGNKAVVVSGNNSSRLDCDLLVCNSYRKYISYTSNSNNYIEGILFETENDIPKKPIINFPKRHLYNGSIKNSSENTNGRFKPVVRILKNIKATMIKKGNIIEGLTPSYFLECLVYNSKDSNFRKTHFREIIVAIMDQFHQDIESGTIANYLVQNKQRKLFGNEDQQWNITYAKIFIKQLIKFWLEY